MQEFSLVPLQTMEIVVGVSVPLPALKEHRVHDIVLSIVTSLFFVLLGSCWHWCSHTGKSGLCFIALLNFELSCYAV